MNSTNWPRLSVNMWSWFEIFDQVCPTFKSCLLEFYSQYGHHKSWEKKKLKNNVSLHFKDKKIFKIFKNLHNSFQVFVSTYCKLKFKIVQIHQLLKFSTSFQVINWINQSQRLNVSYFANLSNFVCWRGDWYFFHNMGAIYPHYQ